MPSERVQRQINRLLDEAEEASALQNWEVVRERAKHALTFDPDNPDAKDFLAAAERALGEPKSEVSTPQVTPTPQSQMPVATTDHPTSFANGRYEVKKFLGEGGKKRVYQAHDSVLDRDVALAVIKTEGLDPTSRVRITREAQAMGRLGDHPHVLQIFDLGDEAGQPYMVLPLMPGGDVGTLLEKAEDHRLPLEQAIDLAAQICRGLEFAHSKAIVHRDLKPGNIWLTSDGTAKIGDFGLAVAIDRSRLTQEGMMVGTVSYMPPEQAMGGDVTPQSDLYSLGAMLYEMVCGRPPFLGDDSVAIIGQHINTPPVAPTWHNPQCPRALEALIMRLLAKDPSERPDSAADVLTALEGIDLAVSAEEPAPERDEAHALDSLAGGVFVGRQREMGELKAALEDTLSGRGSIVTLVGEPGIGKTRTAQELATYASLRGAQVLWGRCYEEQGAPPFCPWLQAIRSHVLRSTPERLQAEMGPGAVDIAGMIPEIREKLLGLQIPPPLPPDQARFRLFESITFFLKSASQERPLVVILDNLHWSDGPSLKLLEFLAPELEGSRVLVLATYRDAELTRRHPLSQTLGELTRERLFRRVLLRGLGREDVARFIEVASGVKPPPGLVQAVHTQTEGNPLFVNEVVRLLVQEGDLGLDLSDGQQGVGERESWSIRIPEGVRVVVGRRLDRLSERCNGTLTVAAVLGREFGLDQLGPLIDELSRDELVDVLEEALAARVIEQLPQELGRYQFTHSLVQHTLAEELSATQCVRMHARIAETLEELYGEQAEAHAAELAQHFFEAAAVTGTEKLVGYSLLAGEHALDEYAFEEALGYFQRALAAKEGQEMDEETASLLFGLGKAQAAILQVRDAQDSLTRAFDYYVEVGDIAQAVAVAEFPVGSSGNTGVPELVVRALELVSADSHEAGRLLSQYGLDLGERRGDYEGAEEAFDRALAIAEREADVALEMWTLARAGHLGLLYLRPQVCLLNNGKAIELNNHIDDPRAEAFARDCVTHTLLCMGDPDGALVHSQSMLTHSERSRYRTGLMAALGNGVGLSLLKGDWQSARELSDRCLTLSPRDPRNLGRRALLEYTLGEFDQGETYMERLLDVGSVTYLFIPLVARITGSIEHFDLAEESARTLVSSPSELPIRAMGAYIGLALMAVQRGDVLAVKEQYAALEPLRTSYPLEARNCISLDRLLGLLSVTMGQMDQAASHFEDALAFCHKAGYRPELAWACCDYADMLLERNDEGDRQAATTLLDESLAISSDLGMRPLMERVLSRKMGLQGIDVSSPQTSIDAVVSAVEVERPNLQPHAAPDGTVTIMFTDIEGSTAMTERLGDQRAQEVLRTHNAIIREQVDANEGFEVKSQGDGFMLAFSSGRTALKCAIAIQQNFAIHEEAHPGEPIRVRIGLHTGEAIKEGEDFFGKTVILAARIACEASGGQILVSSLLKALVESSGEFEFGDAQDVELKGLAGLHQLHQVLWAGGQ